MTDAEGDAVLEHIFEHGASLEGPDDVRSAFEALAEQAERHPQLAKWDLGDISGKGTDKFRMAISGFRKIANAISKANPDFTDREIIDQLVKTIYENHTKAQDWADFRKRTMESSGAKVGETPLTDAESKTAKDLTLPRFARKGPSDSPKGPGPEPRLPTPIPPPLLPGATRQAPLNPEPIGPPISPSAAELDAEIAREVGGPAAINKHAIEAYHRAAGEVAFRGDQIAAWAKRRMTNQDIAAAKEGLSSTGSVAGLRAANNIRSASLSDTTKPGRVTKQAQAEGFKRRNAAMAVIACGETTQGPNGPQWSPNPRKLNDLLSQCNDGITEANGWINTGDYVHQYWGRKWKAAAEKLKEGVLYAQAHWNDPELQNAMLTTRAELAAQINLENQNGFTTKDRENYIPGQKDGEFFTDHSFRFGPIRKLGSQFRQAKTFDSPYAAIKNGPYIPASFDVADLSQSRISNGRQMIAQRQFREYLKNVTDPMTGDKIASEPKLTMREQEITDPITGLKHKINVPIPRPVNAEHGLVEIGPGLPLSVKYGFKRQIATLLKPSQIDQIPMAKEAVTYIRAMKHGFLLVLDTYHPGRVLQYAATMMTGRDLKSKFGLDYQGGLAAIRYRPQDMPEAVAKGLISQKDMDWAMGTVPVTNRAGRTVQIPRHRIADFMIKKGLNAAKLSDALYKDTVASIPVIGGAMHAVSGPLNRWTFDRLIPGLMVGRAVRHFEEYQRKFPGTRMEDIARDVNRDINTRFGNMGQQGIFRSKTFQDMAQLSFIAPMWEEGLVRSELKAYARLAMLPLRGLNKAGILPDSMTPRAGLPALGALGSGMVKGAAAYFALTQAINLVSRGHPTWENPEKDHKLDAYIPVGDHGIWLSPASVMAEVTHDLIRMHETKPKVWDELTQIAENKRTPLFTMAAILGSGKNAKGEQITSTAGVLKEGAKQLVPTSISLGTPTREVAHALAPDSVAPNRPGSIPQRFLGMVGVKTEIGKDDLSRVQTLGRKFLADQGRPDVAPTTTDQPSYAKLRSALRNKDTATAKAVYQELSAKYPFSHIEQAMSNWARRPITGGDRMETLFKYSLSNEELETYSRAMYQKLAEYHAFLDFASRQP